MRNVASKVKMSGSEKESKQKQKLKPVTTKFHVVVNNNGKKKY